MAELYFQNLVEHRPDVAQRATYESLLAFYQYLDQAKKYLDRERPKLTWIPLGVVVKLDPPRGVRDAKAWRRELEMLLREPSLALREVGGVGLPLINRYAEAGILVLEVTPREQVELELSAVKRRTAPLRAVPAVITSIEEIQAALGEEGGVWIELEEPADDRAGPTLEAFFDEDTKTVYEVAKDVQNRDDYARGQRIDILDRNRDRLALKLERLPQAEAVCVRPNTYTIQCELSAIRALQDRPVAGHRPLIRLFEKRSEVGWPDLRPLSQPLAWQVLKHEDRPGTREQRDFVERALRTPDFMLLEGPPGSGKTTAIVELVLQLAAQGGRVLLCASTHVAVDNVIERLKAAERPGGPVLVVRIGDEGRVAEAVKPYCLHRMARTELARTRATLERTPARSRAQDHMLEALRSEGGPEVLEGLLLGCAEVICGTTLGILQHPDIRTLVHDARPWEPLFDTLILDEASKTPFVEFLVPALLAKRWIIVGDRRQLSPYIDEAWIETNIEAALPGDPASRGAFGRALTDAHALAKSGEGAIVVASDEAELRALYTAQLESLFPGEPVVRLGQGGPQPSPLVLGAARAVIGPPSEVAAIEEDLPLGTQLVRLPDGKLAATQRRHEARRRPRRKEAETWSQAVAWRLVRDYELRLLPELFTAEENGDADAFTYTKELEKLMPCDAAPAAFGRVRGAVERVRRVALPSILESLQVGFDPARSGRSGRFWENALSLGLPEAVKMARLVSLRFQHRMHPDIAAFPHRWIYEGKLLETPPKMAAERVFPCPRYRSRSVWIDVRGSEQSPTRNEAEAQAILAELRALSAWAAQEPREEPWSVAVLTFYRGQERLLRERLREATGQQGQSRYFTFLDRDRPVLKVELCTVDRYQGHEADVVMLSFVRTEKVGFLNSPNRLNVALTRARYQLVLFGSRPFLAREKRRAPLCARLAEEHMRKGLVELRYREG